MRSICPAVTQEQSPAPPRSSNGDWTSLGHHDRLPEFPVVTQESCRNSRKTTRFPHHREMRPFFSAGPRVQSRVPSQNSTVGLTPFRPLDGHQEIPVSTREESGVLCFNSRQGLTPQVNLECNPEIPVATGEEQGVSAHKPR